jgi:hypothetical protein
LFAAALWQYVVAVVVKEKNREVEKKKTRRWRCET